MSNSPQPQGYVPVYRIGSIPEDKVVILSPGHIKPDYQQALAFGETLDLTGFAAKFGLVWRREVLPIPEPRPRKVALGSITNRDSGVELDAALIEGPTLQEMLADQAAQPPQALPVRRVWDEPALLQ
jgi:hypothetical protein